MILVTILMDKIISVLKFKSYETKPVNLGLVFSYVTMSVENEREVNKMSNNIKYDFGRQTPYGMYAYLDNNNNIVIGENNPRDGGDLYTGVYAGISTPHIRRLMKDAPKIFDKIWNYYHNSTLNEIDINEIDYLKDFECVLTNEFITKIKRHIPSAFFDETADIMSKENNGQATESDIVFACIERLKEFWEKENGKNLVYVPAHFEKKKN